jgi:AbrB family looped-hinge helix DNA binding protein
MIYRTKIQDGQIVVPSRLRRLAGLAEGDPLDVTFEQGKVLVVTKAGSPRRSSSVPKKTQKQQRDEFLSGLRNCAPKALKRIWAESERKGMDKMTLRQINSEIAAHRREERQKEALTTPVR